MDDCKRYGFHVVGFLFTLEAFNFKIMRQSSISEYFS